MTRGQLLKFVTHSGRVLKIGRRYGWLPGARYTNLRDVRTFDRLGLLDIDWCKYDFPRHLSAAKSTRPLVTIAKDVLRRVDLDRVLDQARLLAEYAEEVVIVPKDPSLARDLSDIIPEGFLLGYSVPTRYGGTPILPRFFRRAVHLLGGRPDVQRRLAESMPVVSLDCNRFTVDACFGDYFDGETFRPHPVGGYDTCVRDSLKNINALWTLYQPEMASCQELQEGGGANDE